MKRCYEKLGIVLLLCLSLDVKAKLAPMPGQGQHLACTKIKKTVLAGNKVYALNGSGDLCAWDIERLDTLNVPEALRSLHYTALYKYTDDIIFLGTSGGEIYRLEVGSGLFSLYNKDTMPSFAICINPKGKMFLMRDNGVYDPQRKRNWRKFGDHVDHELYTNTRFGFRRVWNDKYFSRPEQNYFDSKSRLWMFGSDSSTYELEVFNTVKERPCRNKFKGIGYAWHILHSLFEDSTGNMYFIGDRGGVIYKINRRGKGSIFFDSRQDRDTVGIRTWMDTLDRITDGYEIGVGAYNPHDKCIYFVTPRGVCRVSSIEKEAQWHPQAVLISSSNGTFAATPLGSGMQITFMEFTKDGRLLIETEKGEIGIYANGRLTPLK